MDAEPTQPPVRPKRLSRSRRERMWTGVSGGLAEYFDMDPVLVRLFWVVATVLTAGLALVAYFCLAVIMPADERDWSGVDAGIDSGTAEGTVEAGPNAGTGPHWREGHYYNGLDYRRRRTTAGIVLVGLGVLFLINESGIFQWFHWRYVWPVILIVLGVALLLRRQDWRS